mgnify:CR=1 FL=1
MTKNDNSINKKKKKSNNADLPIDALRAVLGIGDSVSIDAHQPFSELGLDSLMAVRIKNRVEYDFDLPPIQLTAVRDANLYAVEKLIEYAIEHRDEVEELAEAQKGQTSEEIAAAQAELMGGATTVAELEAKLAEAGHPLGDKDEAKPAAADIATDAAAALEVPPPPTNPSGPAVPPPPTNPSGPAAAQPSQSATAAAAEVLNQKAVAEALNSDVPPRDAAERVTFATWAIVTGKSPGGIFNVLPAVTDEQADKMATRLSERVEGTITADDVKKAQNIEELSTTVREFLEAGELDGFVRMIRPAENDDQVAAAGRHACIAPQGAGRMTLSITWITPLLVSTSGAVMAALRPKLSKVERSARIEAPAQALFDLLQDLRQWEHWSTLAAFAPANTRQHSGSAAGRGAVCKWSGPGRSSDGFVEVAKSAPPSHLTVVIQQARPIEGTEMREFFLAPAPEGGTLLRVVASGPATFADRLAGVLWRPDARLSRAVASELARLQALASSASTNGATLAVAPPGSTSDPGADPGPGSGPPPSGPSAVAG